MSYTRCLLGYDVVLRTAVLLFLVCYRDAFAMQLYGAGSPNVFSIFSHWSKDYQYTRDDVSMNYANTGVVTALQQYTAGALDFVCLDRPFDPADAPLYGDLTSVPLMGQAIVVSYNVPALASTNISMIIDRDTLAQIWLGNITRWNDPRIISLNPALAGLLPNADIYMGYFESNQYGLTEVFKRALESFSTEFADAIYAVNRTLSRLPPALRGTAQVAGGSTALRIAWMRNLNNSLTYLNYADVIGAGLPWMSMYNKANNLVHPSTTSVQAAMSSFLPEFSKSNFSIDIYDASGTQSWPIAYMTSLTIAKEITVVDCSTVLELLNFVAWIHTNDGASNDVTSINQVPIDVSLHKRVIGLLTTIQCNGQDAFTTEFLIGSGTPIPTFTSWSVAWGSGTSTESKYYTSTATVAKQQLSSYDNDFAITNNGILSSEQALMPDAILLPATAFALVPAYNVPELNGVGLVLDFDTIAQIYMGNITRWNDWRIRNLNTATVLPDKAIRVVVLDMPDSYTQIFTEVLSTTVSEFADKIGSGMYVSFSVLEQYNTTISTQSLATALAANSYSFSFLPNYDVFATRGIYAASMINSAGKKVAPTSAAVLSALQDYITAVPSSNRTYASFTLGLSEGSWPIGAFGSIAIRSKTMNECKRASALADFIYWTQSSSIALTSAARQGLVLPMVTEPSMQRYMFTQLKNFTCSSGQPVSSLYNCIDDNGVVCSDVGSCISKACVCPSGREGQYCENVVSASSGDSTPIIVGTVVPVAVIMLLLLVGIIIVLLIVIKRSNSGHDDWEINYDELEIGEILGTGGYGAVHKATWKGTEVAVKVMSSEKITKDMERNFKDEVRVMTSLRHPNVVLFMAASTKAPKMCIVMEFMGLGSLFDLLHNELIPEIPFALKAKMAYQASKGMHFLHSSGIVHRDLKSLNLLLDNKWNVKVSDFGLTKFKEDIQKGGKEIAGSVHWAAPEVLNESSDIDYILADVYSFGIILWELLTREQPYFGLSPAAIAVSVIRDNIRPKMPDPEAQSCPVEYEELITSCWHHDPTIRPTFLEIMTRLSSMHGDSASAGGGVTSYTSTSSSGAASNEQRKPVRNTYGSWTLPSATNSSSGGSGSSSSSASSREGHLAAAAGGAVRAPEGEVAIVFTDITRAASLWEFNAGAMRDATLMHNACLRAALGKHRGYEVVFIRDRNSGEGSFCMAFQSAGDALAWCMEVQQALLSVEWPEALLEHPGAAEEWGDTDDRVLFKGLRVRMGVHVGVPKVVRDPMTRRLEYIGPVVNASARITAMTHGGQVVMSQAVFDKIKTEAAASSTSSAAELVTSEGEPVDKKRLLALGKFEMPDSPQGARLYELKVSGLEGRFFGGVTLDGDGTSSNNTPSSATSGGGGGGATLGSHKSKKSYNSDASGADKRSRRGQDDDGLQTVVGEGMVFKEDNFLTSANLCRWIIDFSEIVMGKQVGLGSYGTVYRAKWKGVDVAVKRFIKQKLDERRMLEFRAEMAFLSELHHPNIVLFIGACVKKPNLCIVTEFMKQGSLRDILANTSGIKLPWKQRLRMLRSAALGINYLHSLHPVIVHRDLKPSNLLVDENWNVKVADFGFARIKEENATMTRCGTPCWTAPEVIRGEKYDERCDVFSFGVIMWQMLTRKEPYAGRNFMGVSLDVLEGKRPQIPGDCTADYRKMMKKCWHAQPSKRPSMEQVLEFFSTCVEDDDGMTAA